MSGRNDDARSVSPAQKALLASLLSAPLTILAQAAISSALFSLTKYVVVIVTLRSSIYGTIPVWIPVFTIWAASFRSLPYILVVVVAGMRPDGTAPAQRRRAS